MREKHCNTGYRAVTKLIGLPASYTVKHVSLETAIGVLSVAVLNVEDCMSVESVPLLENKNYSGEFTE